MPAKGDKWVCILCQDNKPHNRQAAITHEKTKSHQDAIKYHSRKQHHRGDGSVLPEAQSVKDKSMAGLHLLLDDMAMPDFELSDSADGVGDYSATTADSGDGGHFGQSLPAITKAMIAQGLSNLLDENDLSDDQGAEMSEDEGPGFSMGRMRHDDGMLLTTHRMKLTVRF